MSLHATENYVQGRFGTWKHARLIADVSGVIPATPNAIIFDEEFNLGPFGCIAHTQRNILPTVSIQKTDGAGGWIATSDYRDAPPWLAGASDPAGYEVIFSYTKTMAAPNGGLTVINENGGTFGVGSDTGGDIDAPYGERLSRIRVVARRSSRVYTPEEQAVIDTYGYRARCTLLTTDLVLWEREFPLEVTPSNQFLLDESIDLADFGLSAGIDRSTMVFEFLRNGKTIRTFLNREYQVGEAFDHPAPPIRFDVRNESPNLPRWNDQNGGGAVDDMYYGDNYPADAGYAASGGLAYQAGVVALREYGDCGEAIMQHLRVSAWREGDLPTTYWDGTRTGVVSLDLAALTSGMWGQLICTALDTEVPVSFVGDGLASQYVSTPYYNQCWTELVPGGGVIVHFSPGTTLAAQALSLLGLTNPYIPFGDQQNPSVDQTKVRYNGYITDAHYGYTLVAEDAFGPVMVNGGSLASVPVSAESFAGCTVRVRLLGAPPHRVGEYPFDSIYSADMKPMNIQLRSVMDHAKWDLGFVYEAATGRVFFNTKPLATDDVVTAGLSSPRDSVVLRSPNGTLYNVRVDNDGTLKTE